MANASPAVGVSFEGRTIGPYRFFERIGRGGMGEVYRGQDERLRRPVALKVLGAGLVGDEKARARFVRETRLACRVIHPYVATVFDVVESGDDLVLVMEHVTGRPLNLALREAPPTPDRVLDLAVEITEALGAIHRAGLVHRDMKPSNVVLTPDGHAKVMDFGLARAVPTSLDSQTEMETLTEDGRGVGTLLYMAPEQVRGGIADARSDLFSLGVLLYEALSGQHPFQRSTLPETVSAILDDPPGRGSEPESLTRSGPLRDIVLHLLTKDPRARYESAETLLADLREVRSGRSLPLIGAGRRRVTLRAIAGAVAGTVVLSGGVWFGLSSAERGRPAAAQELPVASGIVVLPFVGPNGSEDTVLLGSTMASLVRANLDDAGGLACAGSTRTEELLGGRSPQHAATRKRLLELTNSRYMVTARFAEENGALVGAVDVFDAQAPDAGGSFRVKAPDLNSFAQEITAGLLTQLGTPPVAPSTSVTSDSERALLAAEKGRRSAAIENHEDAVRAYSTAVGEDPRFVEAHVGLARSLFHSGDQARARIAADQAADVAAQLGDAIPQRLAIELAIVRSVVHNDRDGELSAAHRLIQLEPDSPESWRALAAAHSRANRNLEALDAVDRAIVLAPRDPSLLLARARFLRRLERWDEARAAFSAAVTATDSSSSPGLRARVTEEAGYLEWHKGDRESAQDLFVEASVKFAESGEPLKVLVARRVLGQFALERGRLPEAERDLRLVADRQIEAGDTHELAITLDSLGLTLQHQGRYDEAEGQFREAIRLFETVQGKNSLPVPYNHLANLFTRTGRGREALNLAGRALALATAQSNKSGQFSARIEMAWAHSALGELEAAERIYQEIVESLRSSSKDIRLARALTGLGWVLEHRGFLERARTAQERARAVSAATDQPGQSAFVVLAQARLAWRSGARDDYARYMLEAQTLLRELQDSSSLLAQIQLLMGIEQLESGHPALAEPLLRQACDGPEAVGLTAPAWSALGETLCARGRTGEGLRAIERARKSVRHAVDSLRPGTAAAACLAAAGRVEEAQRELLATFQSASSIGVPLEMIRAGSRLIEVAPLNVDDRQLRSVRERAREALELYLREAPGGASGSIRLQPEIQRALNALGSVGPT